MKKLRGYRTVIFGTLTAAAPLLLQVLDYARALNITDFFTPKVATLVIFGIGIATVLLRLATTTPVGQSDDEEDGDVGARS